MRNLPIVAIPEPRDGRAVARPDAALAATTLARRDLREDDLPGLLAAFYATVASDDLLAPYFAGVDMIAHMPRITDFWSTLLFRTGRYAGNAFRPHLHMPGLTARHFARWLQALEATVDERYAGEAAEHMKAVGHRIAYSMQLRLGIEPSSSPFPEA